MVLKLELRVGHHQHTTVKSGAIKLTCPMGLTTTQNQFGSQCKGNFITQSFFSLFPHYKQKITAPTRLYV